MGFVYWVIGILKALWIVLSETINIFEKFATTTKKIIGGGGGGNNFAQGLCVLLPLVIIQLHCWPSIQLLKWFWRGFKLF